MHSLWTEAELFSCSSSRLSSSLAIKCCVAVVNDSQTLLTDFFLFSLIVRILQFFSLLYFYTLLRNAVGPFASLTLFIYSLRKYLMRFYKKKKFLLLLLLRWSSQQAVAHHCQARNGLSIWSLKANKRILKGLILMKLAWAVVPSFQLPLQIKVKRNLRRPPVLASQNDYSRRGILYYSWLLSSCASVAQHITATNSKLGPNAFLLLLPLSNIFFSALRRFNSSVPSNRWCPKYT